VFIVKDAPELQNAVPARTRTRISEVVDELYVRRGGNGQKKHEQQPVNQTSMGGRDGFGNRYSRAKAFLCVNQQVMCHLPIGVCKITSFRGIHSD